ncbi:MAG: hypothetical protein C0404_11305 [Verrucomicrobia bacterium]|nr:hypothetical protein [Verrucomicrobiota bacterium]
MSGNAHFSTQRGGDAMKKRISRTMAGAGRLVARLFVLGVAVCIGFVIYCSSIGLPQWLLSMMLSGISEGAFVYEAESARLELFDGLTMRNVKVFRKAVVGPPCIQAEQVRVLLSPSRCVDGAGADAMVSRVEIRMGEIEPFMMMGNDEQPVEAGPQSPATFELMIEDCGVQGLHVKRLECRVVVDANAMRVKGVTGTVGDEKMFGDLLGDVVYTPARRMVVGRVSTSFDPRLAIPLAKAWEMNTLAEVLGRFDFAGSPPACEVELTNIVGKTGWVVVDGKFRYENGSYQGVKTPRADGKFHVYVDPTNATVTVGPIMVARAEGIAQGGFTYEWATQMVDFYGASTIEPKALATMVGIPTNGFMELLRFDGPASVTARGSFDAGTLMKTDFTATYDGRGLGVDRFISDECSVRLHMTGTTVNLTNVAGRIYGGAITGNAIFDIPAATFTNAASSNAIAYSITGGIVDADFGKLAKILKIHEDQGKNSTISANVSIKGLIGDAAGPGATGTGYVRIKDGRVFSMPIFGGLSAFMAKVIPGLDFIMRQTDAKTDFVLSGNRISSDKVMIEGDVLSLTGKGAYATDGKLDFDVQIKLMKEHTLVAKLIRAITYPISKLFEFKLKGTLEEPYWYPVNFSRDVLEKVGL